jgi:hypothetical protein
MPSAVFIFVCRPVSSVIRTLSPSLAVCTLGLGILRLGTLQDTGYRAAVARDYVLRIVDKCLQRCFVSSWSFGNWGQIYNGQNYSLLLVNVKILRSIQTTRSIVQYIFQILLLLSAVLFFLL